MDNGNSGKGVLGSFVDFVLGNIQNVINTGMMFANDSEMRRRDWTYYQMRGLFDLRNQKSLASYYQNLAQQQYAYEYKMESPANQVARLQNAGLSPALMYGGANAGVQASVSTPQPSLSQGNLQHSNLGALNGLSQIADIASASAQSQQAQSNADLNEVRADKEREETILVRLQQKEKEKDIISKDLENIAQRIKNAKDGKELQILLANEEALKKREELVNNQIIALTNQANEQAETEETKRRDLVASAELKDEQKKTEKSEQARNYASARESRSNAEYKDVLTELEQTYGSQIKESQLDKLEQEIATLFAEEQLSFSKESLNELDYEQLPTELRLKIWDVILENVIEYRRVSKMSDGNKNNIARLILALIAKKL